MLRKLAFVFLFMVLGAIGYLSYSVYANIQERKAVEKRIASMPEFSVIDLDGNAFGSKDVGKERPIILTYFNTECHFCQGEIRSMEKHNGLQKNAAVYLISDQPMADLKKFKKSFRLDTLQSMQVLQDKRLQVKKMFGVRGVPSTFVYDTDGRLLKSFEGETKAAVLYELVK